MVDQRQDGDELFVQRVAAVDIGKAEVVCCVRVPDPGRPGRRAQEVAAYSTMTGSLQGLADRLGFAVSGYSTSVDWAASAILEFTYLELILGRGLPPAAVGAPPHGEPRSTGCEGTSSAPAVCSTGSIGCSNSCRRGSKPCKRLSPPCRRFTRR